MRRTRHIRQYPPEPYSYPWATWPFYLLRLIIYYLGVLLDHIRRKRKYRHLRLSDKQFRQKYYENTGQWPEK